MSLKILIVEDEHLGVERLERHLFSIDPIIEIAGTADSVKSAVHWLKSNAIPDLILMDIDLGDGQSFDIFHEVAVQSHVIFTTSYDEFALQAFQANNIDYLLKPIKKRELKEYVDKLKKSKSVSAVRDSEQNIEKLVAALQQQLHMKEFRQRFLVKQGKKLISIELHEIAYFQAEGRLMYVNTKENRKFIIDHSLDELERMLDPKLFFRVNGNCLAGIGSITMIHKPGEGHIILTLSPDNTKVVVGIDRVQGLKDWIEKNDGLFHKKVTGNNS